MSASEDAHMDTPLYGSGDNNYEAGFVGKTMQIASLPPNLFRTESD